jgi:hypothetical protein
MAEAVLSDWAEGTKEEAERWGSELQAFEAKWDKLELDVFLMKL